VSLPVQVVVAQMLTWSLGQIILSQCDTNRLSHPFATAAASLLGG
jgi:hypothetical protein